jgi:alanyl-tRNA synthetase
LGEERATIDVDAPELTPQTLLMAEEAVQDAIEEDAPLIIHHCPPERLEDFPLRKRPPQGEEVIRVVEIQGKDFSPCCGTHLRATGKIGMLRILGAEKYKGMTRIAFIAGRRVLRDSRLLRQNGELISRSLKIPVEETGKGVLALLEKLSTQEKRLKDLEEADALHEAAALIVRAGPGSGADVYQELFPHKTMEELLRIGRAAQKTIPHILVLAAAGELKFAAFTSRKDADIRPLLKTALEQCKGRGGGGPSFFQGSFSDPADLSAFLNALPKTLPQGTAD